MKRIWNKDEKRNVWKLADNRCRATLVTGHLASPQDWRLTVPALNIDQAIGSINDLTPEQAQELAQKLVLNRLNELMEIWS